MGLRPLAIRLVVAFFSRRMTFPTCHASSFPSTLRTATTEGPTRWTASLNSVVETAEVLRPVLQFVRLIDVDFVLVDHSLFGLVVHHSPPFESFAAWFFAGLF
jgi:hypothetical protein